MGVDPATVLRDVAAAAALDPEIVDRCRRLLLPLDRADEERGSRLRATLLAYYASGGSVEKTAEALFLHRNSVRYRLDRVRAMLGLNIDHPDVIAAFLGASAVIEAASIGAKHEAERSQ